jgi:hypothetical protein
MKINRTHPPSQRLGGNFALELGFFTWGRKSETVCFQQVEFGEPRAMYIASEGRKAEDPFRGLRAGPASFPRPLPSHSYPSYRPNRAGSLHSAGVVLAAALLFSAKSIPSKNAWEKNFHSRLQSRNGWGVVQLVGHLTVNEDGVGSSPTAPAKFFPPDHSLR